MTNYQLPDFSSSDDSTSPMVDTPGYPPGYWNGFYSPFEHAPPYHYVPHYPIPRTEIPTSPPRPLPVMEHSPPIFSPEAFEDYGSEKNYFPHTFSEGNSPDNFFFIHRNSDSQPEGSFEQKQTKKSCKKLYNKKERNNVDPKKKKRCSNCSTTKSPSWRRSTLNETKENLLCNACGLYEKTTKRNRMLVTNPDGITKVVRKRDAREYCCSVCHETDHSRWFSFNRVIKCQKCHHTEC